MEASETGPTPEEQGQEGSEGTVEPGAEEGADERNPAREQAPIASDAQEAVIGDPGLRDEQQPVQTEGSPSAVDTPVRTSAPPPEAQSGVPLPEDRAAGVTPDQGAEEDEQREVPEPDEPKAEGAGG